MSPKASPADHEKAAAWHLAAADAHDRLGDKESPNRHGAAREKHLEFAYKHLEVAGHPEGVVPENVKAMSAKCVVSAPEFAHHEVDKMLKSDNAGWVGPGPMMFKENSKTDKEDRIPGGLAAGKKPEEFDPKCLAEGVKVEMEHTTDPKVAQEIAMDHLTEDKDYYKKLKTIEKGSYSAGGGGLEMSMAPKPDADKRMTLMKDKPKKLTKKGEAFVKACCGFLQKEKPITTGGPDDPEEIPLMPHEARSMKEVRPDALPKFVSPKDKEPTKKEKQEKIQRLHDIIRKPLMSKAFEDRWLLALSDQMKKASVLHKFPYEFKIVPSGSQRDYLFKVGACEVVYSVMGNETKVKLNKVGTDPRCNAVAKTLFSKIKVAHNTPLIKAGEFPLVGRDKKLAQREDAKLPKVTPPKKSAKDVRGTLFRSEYSLTPKGEELVKKLYGSNYARTWMEGLAGQDLRREKQRMQRKVGYAKKKPIKSTAQYRLRTQNARLMGFMEEKIGKNMNPPQGGWLKHYTEKYAGKSPQELHHARMDLHHTLKIWDKPENADHPYLKQKLNERDAVLTEIHRNSAGRKGEKLHDLKIHKLTKGDGQPGYDLPCEFAKTSRGMKQVLDSYIGQNLGSYGEHTPQMVGDYHGGADFGGYSYGEIHAAMKKHPSFKPVSGGRFVIRQRPPLTEKGKEFVKAFGLAPQQAKLKHTSGTSMRGRTNIAARAGKPGIHTPGLVKPKAPPLGKPPSTRPPVIHKAIVPNTMGDARIKGDMIPWEKLSDGQKKQAQSMFINQTPVSSFPGHNKPISHEHYHYQVKGDGNVGGRRFLSRVGLHSGRAENLKDMPKPDLGKAIGAAPVKPKAPAVKTPKVSTPKLGKAEGEPPEPTFTPFEMHGVMGTNSKPFRKEFKTAKEFKVWHTKNEGNYEAHGRRDLDKSSDTAPIVGSGTGQGEP